MTTDKVFATGPATGSFHGNGKQAFYRTHGSPVGLRASEYLWSYPVIMQSHVVQS